MSERASQRELRAWLVDTAAMVVFCTLTGMVMELAVAGLSWRQSIAARLAAIPLNLVTARPYGLYRDAVVRQLARWPRARTLQVGLADVLAFTTFQVPVYAAVLALSGAGHAEMIAACLALCGLATVSGYPYGLFLRLCRHLSSGWALRAPERTRV
jgi:hypothetical protein